MKTGYHKKLTTIIPKKYKYFFLFFIFVLIIALTFQLIGISSLIPLSSNFFNNNSQEFHYFDIIKEKFPILKDYSNFFLYLTLTTILMIISNLVFLLSSFLSSSISFAIERDIKIKLYQHYLSGNYINFFNTETSDLLSLLINETQRISSQVLIPLADIISRLFIVLGIIGFLIYLIPNESIIVIFALLIFYVVFFLLLKNKIKFNNVLLSLENKSLIKITNNLFKSFKEIKIYNLENGLLNKVQTSANQIRRIKFFSTFFSNSPRYLLEILLFLGIYFFLNYQSENLEIFIESYLIVIIYCLFKLLPSIQGIFSLFVVINSHINSVNEIYDQLIKINSKNFNKDYNKKNSQEILFKKLELKNVTFGYSRRKILNKINLKIFKGEKIGIEGPSGSGKSTIINLIAGLLEKNSGKIFLDNESCSSQKLLNFSKYNIGYVSQYPAIFEGTIKENIILDKIYDKVYFDRCVELSEIKSFINSSKLGIEKKIHGSNSNLSGGQIQRILIARALYRRPKLIIIDEGFSQLDKENELKLLNKILKVKDLTVLMIYHKLFNKSLLNKRYLLNKKKLILLKNT